MMGPAGPATGSPLFTAVCATMQGQKGVWGDARVSRCAHNDGASGTSNRLAPLHNSLRNNAGEGAQVGGNSWKGTHDLAYGFIDGSSRLILISTICETGGDM